MARLMSETRNQLLVGDLRIARRFFERGIGLLGYKNLGQDQALLIHHCFTIHTFFMRFSIDCVFVDQQMAVSSLHREVAPWRMVWSNWRSRSVIEMPSGSIDRLGIRLGEKLHVGT